MGEYTHVRCTWGSVYVRVLLSNLRVICHSIRSLFPDQSGGSPRSICLLLYIFFTSCPCPRAAALVCVLACWRAGVHGLAVLAVLAVLCAALLCPASQTTSICTVSVPERVQTRRQLPPPANHTAHSPSPVFACP